MTRLLVLSSALAVLAYTAAAETPPAGRDDKSPPEGGRRGEKGKGDWHGGPGMSGGYGRPPGGHNDGFDQLPEDQKRRVREALNKVWGRPEVIEARDRSMKANEDFKDAIRAALIGIDPEVVKIMDRVRPADHFDPRKLPKLPPPDSTDFPRVVLQRLGMEVVGFARPDRREEMKRTHERIIALPEVQSAYNKVVSTSGEERIQAMQKLRELYRSEVGKAFQLMRDSRPDQDGDVRRPPGPPPPPSR